MSKSALLRVEDVRAIVRLVGECRDQGDNPDAWEEHLFRSVARLLGSALVTGGDFIGLGPRPRVVAHMLSWGWQNGLCQDAWVRGMEHFKGDRTFAQSYVRYMERFPEENGVAYTKGDLVSNREWEASAEYECSRQIGVSHSMACLRMLPGAKDGFRILSLWRAAGERDFSLRDRVLLREVQAAIVPLIGGPLAPQGEPSPADLAPRVRQVLRCLLEGDGDKQIAARLGLTRHTVNQYAKALFRHFGVESRAELLARWVRRGFPARFSWEDE
jgi:DNA-binding CsgD family transcriptional regulator